MQIDLTTLYHTLEQSKCMRLVEEFDIIFYACIYVFHFITFQTSDNFLPTTDVLQYDSPST